MTQWKGRGRSSLCLGDKEAWVSSSLLAPAPLLRHSSYAVMLGHEPSLRSTFPRAGGARKGSPITKKHCWPWAALDGSRDSRNCWGAGLRSHCFHGPRFCQALQDHVHPQSWERDTDGHLTVTRPSAACPLFWDLGSAWCCF